MAGMDILSALLGADAGGGADTGGGNSDALGALAAFQSSPFLQGEPSRSGPIGQIAQSIMPLLTAKVMSERAGASAQAAQRENLLTAIKLANEISETDLKRLELKQKLHPDFAPIIEFVRAIKGELGGEGGGLGKGVKLSVKGPGDSTISLGGADEPDTLFGLINAEAEGAPGASAKLGRYADLQSIIAGGRAQAGVGPALDVAQGRADIAGKTLAKPPQKIMTDLATSATAIATFDRVLASLERGEVTRGDAMKATLSGGLLSNPTLRDYASAFNLLTRRDIGAAQTKQEFKNVSQRLPRPASFALDPEGFKDAIRTARASLHRAGLTDIRIFGDRYDMSGARDEYDAILGASPGANPSAPSAGTGMDPADAREGGISQLMQEKGWDRARAEAVFDAVIQKRATSAE